MMKIRTLPSVKPWPDKKTLKGFIILPKPGIVMLVIVSGYTGLILGSNGMPDSYTAFWTLLGLSMATAGSAVLNNFLDRDIDSVMHRTRDRSLPSGAVSANQAYIIGTVLVAVSLSVLKISIGFWVTVLTGAAVFNYVVMYTMYLKRTTPLATHIGGVAGALPPMIGYTAAKGVIDDQALILFLIIVVWQQPHFWSLALKYRKDYARASVPILPVAKGVYATKIRLFWYTLALLPVSVLPFALEMAGIYYLIAAIAAGALYMWLTVKFLMSDKDKEMVLFFYSIAYLMVIFGAMVIDLV
ncbi:MAG: heme o synthase [Nitrospinota bacterium]